MHDNYAEALDEVVVCITARADVHTYLLSEPRITARITDLLGHRLRDLEQRLSDTVLTTVPQRIASTLTALAAQQSRRGLLTRGTMVVLVIAGAAVAAFDGGVPQSEAGGGEPAVGAPGKRPDDTALTVHIGLAVHTRSRGFHLPGSEEWFARACR